MTRSSLLLLIINIIASDIAIPAWFAPRRSEMPEMAAEAGTAEPLTTAEMPAESVAMEPEPNVTASLTDEEQKCLKD